MNMNTTIDAVFRGASLLRELGLSGLVAPVPRPRAYSDVEVDALVASAERILEVAPTSTTQHAPLRVALAKLAAERRALVQRRQEQAATPAPEALAEAARAERANANQAIIDRARAAEIEALSPKATEPAKAKRKVG
jgi:hypothetical protein